MRKDLDEYYMKRSMDLAKKGAGFVSPNPLVGAVLVKNQKIIGEGYHRKYGEPHAEVMAIDSATESVKGSTLYCNLEPCSHYNKKTPPCAQRIIREGITRVIISNLDPNPYVNGRGVKELRDAGLSVDTGILENRGAELNRFFFKFIKSGIPYVTVKIAQTVDGYITRRSGLQSWISGEKSRRLVHRWRSEYDAVLIGAGTVLTDNPRLDVRFADGRNPYRIILDPRLRISGKYNILSCEDPHRTVLLTSLSAEQKKLNQVQETNCKIIQLPENDIGLFSWKDIMKSLSDLGIISVLIEGGQHIFSQVVCNNLFDDLRVFIAPRIWGDGLPAISGEVDFSSSLFLTDFKRVGEDLLLSYLPG